MDDKQNKALIEWQNNPTSVTKKTKSRNFRHTCSENVERCRTSGGRTRLKQLKIMQTPKFLQVPHLPEDSV